MTTHKNEWERIKVLGGGGQSEVYLVRTPERTAQRNRGYEFLRTFTPTSLTGLDDPQRLKSNQEFVEALQACTRADQNDELGAMKEFNKFRDNEEQSIKRLEQEIGVLSEERPGLPKLIDSNVDERWLVVEYFPKLTLEHHMGMYKGNPALALKAFQSLVKTVAKLHDDNIIHRDIKPQNIFVRGDHELVLGDFGIVYLPKETRLTFKGESVGASDFIPPWAEKTRLEDVKPSFDVYMLGKLLWCMVSGQEFLRREFFKDADTDVTKLFPSNPHAYMINEILERCVVDREEKCQIKSAGTLLDMVDADVRIIERGAQLLCKGVPRLCHVCGYGHYHRQELVPNKEKYGLRLWVDGVTTTTVEAAVYMCNACGHFQFFNAKMHTPNDGPS
jgi:serine/threonine protein kinase